MGRQFVVDATTRGSVEEHRLLGERLLCEKISRHGICRAIGVSLRGLRDFRVARFAAVPAPLQVQPRAASCAVLRGYREVEADEWWSVVQQKAPPHWG